VTECNGCGSCCDPVTIPYTKLDAATDYTLDDRTRRWVLDDLTPMSRRDVLDREPWLLDKSTRLSAAVDGGDLFVPYFYSCRWFDETERRCTNWDDRPAPCRMYPWLDEPQPTAALPPTCSFRADIGQPVEIRA
jgi:Fe-S-cluster containining protein